MTSREPKAMKYLNILLAIPNPHLQSLEYQVQEAARIYELLGKAEDFSNKPSKDIVNFSKMQHYTLSAIIVAFAFVEAQINDFFGKCNDTVFSTKFEGKLLSEAELQIIRKASKVPGFERLGTLVRYDEALRLTGRDGFDKGREPYQSMKTLQAIRNSLVHLQHSSERKDVEAIERALKCKSIVPVNIGPYPYSYLIGPTAEWALAAATDFYGDFCMLLHAGSPDYRNDHLPILAQSAATDTNQ